MVVPPFWKQPRNLASFCKTSRAWVRGLSPKMRVGAEKGAQTLPMHALQR